MCNLHINSEVNSVKQLDGQIVYPQQKISVLPISAYQFLSEMGCIRNLQMGFIRNFRGLRIPRPQVI
ncbi:hypothetical protein M8J75_008958 [Diaphorina citri]|nr:hypothetical protein M8J75_008958 [Diaphorina citri]